jgi:signal transduction histidine kinase
MREIDRLSLFGEQSKELSGISLPDLWRKCSLAARFTIVATIVVGISMAILGRWVANRIETSVITNTATAAALYMDRFVEPLVQELATGPDIGDQARDALSKLVKSSMFKRQVIAVKIWRPDGTIAYSNFEGLIGKRFPVSDVLAKALSGTVAPEFNHLGEEESLGELALGKPLLEIYSPIRQTNTARIIAVAEFYQLAESLARQLELARLEGFMMVGGLSLLMLAALIGIVRQGSRIIANQQIALNGRIDDLSKSLTLNQELRERVAEANRRATESGERFLRRVSAELHDGPVQLIGLALLRLDSIGTSQRRKDVEAAPDDTLEIIRGALKDAMCEIRGLSHGLALPELEKLSFLEALDLAITNHERRSGTSVAVNFPEHLPAVPASIKTCAYRFVQEGLNNAFRHANGTGQRVLVSSNGVKLDIEVSDEGHGLSETDVSGADGLGLAGMRDRIESLGGSMIITGVPGQGTRLQVSFAFKNK